MAGIQTKTGRTGKKQYVVRWRDTVGRDRSRSFDSPGSARKFRGEIESSLASGTYVDPGAAKVTLRRHADEWLRMSSSAPSTKAKYRSLLDSQILPALGDLTLAQMNPMVVKDFLVDRSGTLKASTVSTLAATLSSLSHAAVDHGLLAKGWMPRRLELPTQRADERVFLSPDQILAIADTVPPLYRALVLTAGWTGMRWGELAGLKERRLDLDQGRIDIVEAVTYTGGVKFGPPKSARSRRTIRITPTNVDILRSHLAEFGTGQQGVVFHGAMGGVLDDTTFRRRVWVKAIKALDGEVPAETRFHDLRHSAAAIAILAGYDLLTVSRRLGHSTVATTADVYGHVFREVEDRHLDSLAALTQIPAGYLGDRKTVSEHLEAEISGG